jgi:hypothetical protein
MLFFKYFEYQQSSNVQVFFQNASLGPLIENYVTAMSGVIAEDEHLSEIL